MSERGLDKSRPFVGAARHDSLESTEQTQAITVRQMQSHGIATAVVVLGILSRFFGCAPHIGDLRVEGAKVIARDQIGGDADLEPKRLKFEHYLLIDISSRTNLANVDNDLYVQIGFCGTNQVDQIGVLGPYNNDKELHQSRTIQTAPKNYHIETWPLVMTPNPKTGRYLYGLYVITQRTPDQSNLSPSPGEFSMEPYDIGRDHRPLCIKLEMLQYLWTPKYSNTATLPEKMVKLAYDRFGT